jgi:thiamine-monophosphate kinase
MAGRTVGDVGEVDLVGRILDILARDADDSASSAVRVGPGDDAAILACDGSVVLTTDSQHEGVHFRCGWITPEQLGRRAIAVNASDLGAMGARPRGFLVALALPPETELEWVDALALGLRGGARRYGASIVGGDVAGVPGRISINVTAVGEGPEAPGAGRDGAEPGQQLLVTGWPGRAAAGRRILQSDDDDGYEGGAARTCVRAFLDPDPPVDFGVAVVRSGRVAAMMDISDGVAIDLGRLCRASGVGAALDGESLFADPVLEAVGIDPPLDVRSCVLGGGEDYELLCAVADVDAAAFRELAAEHGVEVRAIGRAVDQQRGVTLDDEGRTEPLEQLGWDHFA